MNAYNPFEKPIDALDASDLAKLQSVFEGWYVEYKVEVPNASSIAKSISALANTYGGWLFYGIAEKAKAEAVAGSFPGIPTNEIDPCLQRIRQAVAHSVNPSPHFEVRAVLGPNDEIGLASDRAIICVMVPRGHATPYVHRSGQIYRRVGDGSEPKPETDRFVLDQLWKRGEQLERDYAEWLGRDLELSSGEEETPYLRLFLVPDLWRDQDIWCELTTARVREIMAASHDVEATFSSTPFDTVYRTAAGFVCRQLRGNDPQNLTATWFLRPNLVSEIVVPLPCFEVSTYGVEAELDGYDNAAAYAKALRSQGHTEPRIVDLNFVFSSLIGVMHIQSLLDREAQRSGSIHIKAQLLNVWRTRPFLDVSSVVEAQAQHGVPVCMNDQLFTPLGKEPGSFWTVPPQIEAEAPAERKFQQAMIAFEPIAQAFGIETWADQGVDGSSGTSIHADLYGAGNRAMVAQERRNSRKRRKNV